ncbi:MAG: hydrogenase [Betaproteobacteria bacterium RIFCSPLOWO2_02_67_12]|nr:MAG: hydrogenase [Betaproteobacteria bacterium RIFCSPLOWO2_02_67_12]OGA27761.1 MAG: hydrogenase [Betaproteobacteria bacterium RIFCSPLOWO2_02_FULL_68_150]OGA68896.1 MAG: hydrogenase [Betaproteobacteria bacterium RIFCSPLOWO2_12_FULL_67_28]
MTPEIDGIELVRLPGAVPAWRASVDANAWLAACAAVARGGGRLGALWASDERDRGSGFTLRALLVAYEGLICLELPLPPQAPEYPDLAPVFPCAARMQRAAYDLLGVRAAAPDGRTTDTRGWLRHGAWQPDAFPLRRDVPLATRLPAGDARYAFVTVEGDGVHEIPVGPVHAGTIEPGHFRFSIVGERVLRLEQRLGYKHKGVEKRFESMTLADGARLAGRVSGDSTVAYAWAYAMALEGMAGARPSRRALWLRALLLERERIANHLGDLGYLGNDGGLAFGLAQFSRLKEDLLRANARAFGHRYLMDRVVPGGVACDVDAACAQQLIAEGERLEDELRTLRAIYYDHAGLQDRCITCGRLTPRTAARLGVVGLAARASGHAIDARAYPGHAPYDELPPSVASHRNGDVAARIVVRFEEAFESLRLQRLMLQRLPEGALSTGVTQPAAGAFGIGWIEGWRGEVLVALEAGAGGTVRRCHPHDPSWQNWPALEYAVIGNIVPDFPLINKSFNLSYAGQDL